MLFYKFVITLLIFVYLVKGLMASPSRPSRQFQDIDDDDDLINTPPTQNPKPFVADSAAYAQLLDLGFNPNAIFRVYLNIYVSDCFYGYYVRI